MSTCILHDYYEAADGGGRLCSILAHGLPAALAYGFSRPEHPFLQQPNTVYHDLQARSNIPLWRQWKLALAYQAPLEILKQYETLIYSGFYTPLAALQNPQAQNILYCHTPPRFIYDQRDFFLQKLPLPLRPLLHHFLHYLQPRYEQAVQQMDVIIANSKNVQQRIQQYLHKDSIVVYPPCDTARFRWLGQGDYYLSLGRLDPLKQVDKVIKAFLKMPDKKLIVTSGGSEEKALKKQAQGAKNIHFTGWLEESELLDLIGHAIACIYVPKDEDFGMSPVEAMAAGKPMIGVAEGGLLETIIPEQTGILLPADLPIDSLCEAVCQMTAHYAETLRIPCEQQAQNFDHTIFLTNMQQILNP